MQLPQHPTIEFPYGNGIGNFLCYIIGSEHIPPLSNSYRVKIEIVDPIKNGERELVDFTFDGNKLIAYHQRGMSRKFSPKEVDYLSAIVAKMIEEKRIHII